MEVHDAELEVTVTLKVVTPTSALKAKILEELGRPPSLFERMFGFWEGY